MRADEVLRLARRDGRVVRSTDVSRATYPSAARSYLADGSGAAWSVPEKLWDAGVFTLDAEVPVAVRPTLVRRYGIDDPVAFARAWTRAEALAKLDDLPIVTWLSRHGLGVPARIHRERAVSEIAWETSEHGDMIVTFAVRLRPRRLTRTGARAGSHS